MKKIITAIIIVLGAYSSTSIDADIKQDDANRLQQAEQSMSNYIGGTDAEILEKINEVVSTYQLTEEQEINFKNKYKY